MKKIVSGLLGLTLVVLLGIQTWNHVEGYLREWTYGLTETTRGQQLVHAYAEEHGLRYADYPASLIDLLDRNPETSKFVLEYPYYHGKELEIDLSEYENSESIPLFLQWDQRWGYLTYGSNVAGITACGPMCLAMAGYYLTGDEAFSPEAVMEFAQKEGYYVPGSGSSWKLISEGGEKLGLDVEELPLHRATMERELEQGWPIICIMGPGDFTTTGHYILLTGVQDGAFTVNDPNSLENSGKLWTYEAIEGQIRNIWVIRTGPGGAD